MVKTRTGFPESQWNSHSSRYSKLSWTGPWATGFKFEASHAFIRRLDCRHPDIASNLNYSLSLWNSSSLRQQEIAHPVSEKAPESCMNFFRSKELSHSSSHAILQKTGSWNHWQRKDLLRDWILYDLISCGPRVSRLCSPWRGQLQQFCKVDMAWSGGISPFPHGISLHGSLLVRLGAKGIIWPSWESLRITITCMCVKWLRTVYS